ncbi:hypothetical protein M413DRAFT_438975 [Hebeloma cylindrosporum]|uniref:Uncharacterized protein n=1 Tax=Hebeloma cylindrosporum TaxID=76867 RepID=A0A0C3D0A4_HEBCY|nr:hypothetical protein M413DRAFT_438975 [Hebeloma cylindrosporum h7]
MEYGTNLDFVCKYDGSMASSGIRAYGKRKEVREAWDGRAQVCLWAFRLVKVLLYACVSSVDR